ncbi:hypothetical protein B0J13DRAFT_533585 [Dactylonectria estremocensis]|uniref:Uncharacterized protein n=1 Tax=Dactylonectria estremocensis TaxID=1079267 RepID=A0A9P9IB10_9HYPO|nr:hypothetical protein B0J13DRAFT_533585 [Dactylonectria estremocensis]
MSAQQHLIAILPASKQVLEEESFINGELASKILPGIRQTEDADASGKASDIRKRRIEDKKRRAVKRLKRRPFRDSVPTPWKADSSVKRAVENYAGREACSRGEV